MRIRTTDTLNINRAARVASERYGNNLRLDIVRKTGRFCHVKLNVFSSRGLGAHRSHSGRRTIAPCWHLYRDFMIALYEIDPTATIVTGIARYENKADFEAKFEATGWKNIGSIMYPVTYRSSCCCDGDGAYYEPAIKEVA